MKREKYRGPHYQFTYNPRTHKGMLVPVANIRGEMYIASSKEELITLKETFGELAQALANAVGDTVDPKCKGVGVMMLDLVSSDEEIEAQWDESESEMSAYAAD